MGVSVLALGHSLPEYVERAGARRPIRVAGGGPSALAVPAAQAVLARAGVPADAVDFIIFATMTPDVMFPGAGCFFQQAVGCGTVGALDVRAQCAGFIFAIGIADQLIRAGTFRHVLVVGAEVHSSGLDYDGSPEVARLFGDGAGAALLGRQRGTGQIHATTMHTDGRHHRQFWCEHPSSRQHPVRVTIEDVRLGRHFPTVEMDAVRQFGEDTVPAVIDETVRTAAMQRRDIDAYVIAHLLPVVAESSTARLGIPGDRLIVPARRYGHLAAAAVPVALSAEMDAGRLGPGATVCVAAAGAGFAWGGAVITL